MVSAPERFTFEMSLERMSTKFNFTNKQYVSRLIDSMKESHLVNVTAGKFNPYTLQNDTNSYSLNYLTYFKATNPVPASKGKDKSVQKVTKQRQIVAVSHVEKQFLDFCEKFRFVFVDLKVISTGFKGKIQKRMIPNLLSFILSNEFLRGYFYKEFSNENILIDTMKGLTPVKTEFAYQSRFVEFTHDRVVLVDTGGNYTGRSLRMKQDEQRKAVNGIRSELKGHTDKNITSI
jgi:hypothetical protein